MIELDPIITINVLAVVAFFVRMERRFSIIETILKECPYCHRHDKPAPEKIGGTI